MRRAARAAALTLAMAAVGCSGNDDSASIQDFCKQGSGGHLRPPLRLRPAERCPGVRHRGAVHEPEQRPVLVRACPSGKSFDSSAADQCVAAYPNASCSDLAQGTYPTACTTVCR